MTMSSRKYQNGTITYTINNTMYASGHKVSIAGLDNQNLLYSKTSYSDTVQVEIHKDGRYEVKIWPVYSDGDIMGVPFTDTIAVSIPSLKEGYTRDISNGAVRYTLSHTSYTPGGNTVRVRNLKDNTHFRTQHLKPQYPCLPACRWNLYRRDRTP
jgi:hypothetical protein